MRLPNARLVLVAGLVVIVTAGLFWSWWSHRPQPQYVEPTTAELSQPDRAQRLVGDWILSGIVVGGRLSPVQEDAPPTLTFIADGTSIDRRGQEVTEWSYDVDEQGRLHLWMEDDFAQSYQGFFFRDGQLFVEGEGGTWAVYRRK